MATPKVLVLLASYNGSKWIAPQIESILRQSGVDVSIVVRDDGSTDDTRDKVTSFIESGRVRLCPGSTPSGSAAQNFFTLIQENAADDVDFVAFADQDDIWSEDKLSVACRALASRSAVGYSSAVTAFWESGREKALRQCLSPTRSDYLFEGAGQGCTFVLTVAFYRRARAFLLEQSHLIRALHYHDWTIYALARAWNLPWTIDPRPTLKYRQHDGNDTGARNSLTGIGKRLRLIRSGWYSRQLAAVAELCSVAAPENSVVTTWRSIVKAPRCARRRLQIARFCLQGGRRRAADNSILLAAAILGWL